MCRCLFSKRLSECAALFPSRASQRCASLNDSALLAERAGIAYLYDAGCLGALLFCCFVVWVFGCLTVCLFCCFVVWLFCGCLCFLLFQIIISGDGYAAVGCVRQHSIHNFCHLLFQLADKLLGIICVMLNIAQFFLPDACQLT